MHNNTLTQAAIFFYYLVRSVSHKFRRGCNQHSFGIYLREELLDG
jgi:hypothetical protein